jgi:hypothetical protein
MRRRSARVIKLIAGGQPLACWCGSTEHDYSFVRFPMEAVSRCKSCGAEYRCTIQPSKPPPKPKPPSGPPDFEGYPPFYF